MILPYRSRQNCLESSVKLRTPLRWAPATGDYNRDEAQLANRRAGEAPTAKTAWLLQISKLESLFRCDVHHHPRHSPRPATPRTFFMHLRKAGWEAQPSHSCWAAPGGK